MNRKFGKGAGSRISTASFVPTARFCVYLADWCATRFLEVKSKRSAKIKDAKRGVLFALLPLRRPCVVSPVRSGVCARRFALDVAKSLTSASRSLNLKR